MITPPAAGTQKTTRRRGEGETRRTPRLRSFRRVPASPRRRVVFTFCFGSARHAAARQLHAAVDAVDDDRRAAAADLGAELILFELAHHGDVRHVGVDAAIDARHFDVGVEVFGELNLDAAVDAADVDAALAQAHDVDFHVPIDAVDVGIADGLADFVCAVDAAHLDRAINRADRRAAIDAADLEVNRARQAQRYAVAHLVIALIVLILFAAHDQAAARRLLDVDFVILEVFAVARQPRDVDFGGRPGCRLDVHRAVDTAHFDARSRGELVGLVNLVAFR